MSRQQQDTLEQEQWEMEQKKVYGAIAAVMKDLATSGIGKDRRNAQQGYNFRGIDDAYNALAPILARHGLVILPRILTRASETRKSAKGGDLFYVTVEAEFDIVSAEDGSMHTVRTFGEAMDSADKATNKAMSAAYKYMAFQAFCIPTEGDNDADATTHQLAQEPQKSDEELAADALKSADSADVIGRRWTNIAKLFKSDPDTLQRLTVVKDDRLRQLATAEA